MEKEGVGVCGFENVGVMVLEDAREPERVGVTEAEREAGMVGEFDGLFEAERDSVELDV